MHYNWLAILINTGCHSPFLKDKHCLKLIYVSASFGTFTFWPNSLFDMISKILWGDWSRTILLDCFYFVFVFLCFVFLVLFCFVLFFVFILFPPLFPKTYQSLQTFHFECTWWVLFQKRVMHSIFDI